ncbi:MAG TPA: glycosyltransferase family 2 protein [Candidatus Polarisedimenticolaceae bacterium]
MELSVVIPCLNEADTLETCIRKALTGIAAAGVEGEVVVADNGSTDGSREIAARCGARVVPVADRGYGNALRAGIASAKGRFVIMGDADDSYDFLEIPRFVKPLREGADLVQGCRLPSGGGTVMPGAMPFLHRFWGNPMFSALARRMFRAPIHDVYCGLRGFRREFVESLDLRCAGMEYATEMVIKASLGRARFAEVPVTLHPDGRKSHAPHLRTFRDGWRTLRFFLLCSPRWLFLVPGLALLALGALGYALALPGVRVFGARLDVHTLLVASLSALLGFNLIVSALCAKVFAITEGVLPEDPRLTRFFDRVRLEHGLIAGTGLFVVGVGLVGVVAAQWRASGFGPLDYAATMRWVIPGTFLAALGFQTMLSSFLLSVLGLRRR